MSSGMCYKSPHHYWEDHTSSPRCLYHKSMYMWLDSSFCAFSILLFVKSFHIWGWGSEYTFFLDALTTVVFAIL